MSKNFNTTQPSLDDAKEFMNNFDNNTSDTAVGIHTGEESTGTRSADKNNKGGQSELLIDIGTREAIELWHDADGYGYTTIEISGLVLNHKIDSSAFKKWLRGRCYQLFQKAPNEEVVKSATRILDQKALSGKEYVPSVRVGEHAGCIYVDLCDAKGHCVEITSIGWSVILKPPVKFLRKKSMRPLPVPVQIANGNTKPLWDLLTMMNIKDKPSQIILAGYILTAYRPKGPYFVLVITGPQGSAKSTTTKAIKRFIDPAVPLLRALPRSPRDMAIGANSCWCSAFDNISFLQDWYSDAFCGMSTGRGFATRTLNTDEDETIFDLQRPVILNGIEDFATRGDLIDRAITLELPPIPDNERMTDEEFWERHNGLLPEALGVIYNALSSALSRKGKVDLRNLPRMADGALWVAAAEPSLGLNEGTFAEGLARSRREAVLISLEASALAQIMQRLVERKSRQVKTEGAKLIFEGTFSELLEEFHNDVHFLYTEILPKSPAKLSNKLKRIEPALKEIGIGVIRLPRAKERKLQIYLEDQKTSTTASDNTTIRTNNACAPDFPPDYGFDEYVDIDDCLLDTAGDVLCPTCECAPCSQEQMSCTFNIPV